MSLRPFAHPRLWRGVFALMIIGVFMGSLLPTSQLPDVDLMHNDKLLHFSAYFLLMAFAVQLRDAKAEWSRAAFALLLMGIVIEFLQHQSGFRRADIRDVYANAAGVVAGALIAWTPARAWLLALDQRFNKASPLS